MCSTLKDQVNADLLAFVGQQKMIAAEALTQLFPGQQARRCARVTGNVHGHAANVGQDVSLRRRRSRLRPSESDCRQIIWV
jgi:hypothetical protein